MAERLTQSGDYFVTQVDGVEFIVYVEDINFLRGEDPEIVHEGNLEFTVYGIGNGQQPHYFMVTTTDGEFAHVRSTASCNFDSCTRGMDLGYDFSTNPNTVYGGDYTNLVRQSSGDDIEATQPVLDPVQPSDQQLTSTADGEPTATFYGEPVLITWGGDTPNEPRGWSTATETDDVNVTVDTPINDSYCAGDTASVRLDIENQVVSGSVDIQIDVANQITGDIRSYTKTIPESGARETIDIAIPEGTNGTGIPVTFISVNGGKVYQDNANIGARSSEISFGNIDIPSSVMSGDSFTGSVEVSNSSDCNVDVTLSSTKN